MHDIFFFFGGGGMGFNNKFPGEMDFEKTQFKNVKIPIPACPHPHSPEEH